MSGTSADAVDAALVRIRESQGRLRARLLAFHSVPHPPELRARILRAAAASASALAVLDVELGRVFGAAANAVIAAGGLANADVDLIGSHGQTVVHLPPSAHRVAATLQIGRAAEIAVATGLPVVSDFRSADMARGGEGAPLVPLVDQLLFAKPGVRRVLLNLGGIANLSVVQDDPNALVAFDAGPGNALLDALVRVATRDAQACDEEGARAARGSVLPDVLATLLEHPFLKLPPPRSADRDAFGEALARRLLDARGEGALDDLLATAVAFTAECVARALEFLPERGAGIEVCLASGGGVRNVTLMRALARRLAPLAVRRTDSVGIPAQAKEGIAFAVLARQTLLGRAGNVPGVTGASGPAVLGVLTP